jgi:hypothetical protein
MNQIEYPSLNNAETGIVFQKHTPSQPIDVDYQALEIACVDMISKLENLLAKSNEMSKDDFIDESGLVARKMLEVLKAFGDEFLTGNAAAQAKEEIDRALTFTYTYEEVQKTRPLANAIIRAFWNIQEREEILTAHVQLGKALVRACAATCYHAIMMIGVDNQFRKDIDQSTVVFVKQLQKSWS